MLTDVDGVLTDNGMTYSSDGSESKTYSARDGKGFELLRRAGIRTGILTSEDGPQIRARAKKLQVDALYAGTADKLADAKELCARWSLQLDEVAFIGDDVHDVGLLSRRRVGRLPGRRRARRARRRRAPLPRRGRPRRVPRVRRRDPGGPVTTRPCRVAVRAVCGRGGALVALSGCAADPAASDRRRRPTRPPRACSTPPRWTTRPR